METMPPRKRAARASRSISLTHKELNMKIITYNDRMHRNQVIKLWQDIFGYSDKRNDPSLVIDKKISINDNLFFVAINNVTVIGTIMAGYDGHRGWIYSLAVNPLMRRNKIGTTLLNHAEKVLKELGCVKINLQILETTNSIKKFYDKNGYAVEARISMGKEIKENIITNRADGE